MKKIIFAFVIVGMFTACEDFLTKKPYESLDKDGAITSLDDCEVALRGLYSIFRNVHYYGKELVILPDLMTDEAMASAVNFSNTYGILHSWTFNSGDQDLVLMWETMYKLPANASFMLDQIDAIPGDETRKKNIKGEALLARAIAHFDLVRMFAKTYKSASAATDPGVPVITKFEIAEPPRASVAEVYDQIIQDATDAKALITSDEADAITLTKGAVDAFLARVYLTMGDWDNAIKHATAVIENTKYQLADENSFNDIFLNDKGSEIIWKVGLTASDAGNRTPGSPYYNDAQSAPNPDYIPSTRMLELYDDEPGDIRFDTYFKEVATSQGWTGYLVYKFPTNPAFAATTNGNGANMAKVFRLAEQYLIRAEAYAEKGNNDANALADLNTLRTSRILNYTETTGLVGNALKDAIWTERQKELAYEGHHWFDLKRKGLGFKREPRDYAMTGPNFDQLEVLPNNNRWLLPIPEKEMNANSNITENNPGY